MKVNLKRGFKAKGDTTYSVVEAFSGDKPNWRKRCHQALVYTVSKIVTEFNNIV